MSTKQDEQLLLRTALAEHLGVKPNVITYYSRLGLLPFETKRKGGQHFYRPSRVEKSLAEINKLKNSGKTLQDIVRLYAKAGKLTSGVDLTAIDLAVKREEAPNE